MHFLLNWFRVSIDLTRTFFSKTGGAILQNMPGLHAGVSEDVGDIFMIMKIHTAVDLPLTFYKVLTPNSKYVVIIIVALPNSQRHANKTPPEA